MANPNGRKPPNPQKVPKVHGRKPANPQKARRNNGRTPPPPPARPGRNMGKSSSSASPTVIGLAWAFLMIPIAGIAFVGLVITGVV